MTKTVTTLIEIATPDGRCTAEVAKPEGAGKWPAVVVFFDAGGLRPAQTVIAQRVAAMGYVAIQPDLYHRSRPLSEFLGTEVTAAAVHAVFQDDARRAKFRAEYYFPALDYGNLTRTIGAVLEHIGTRPDVTGKVGTTGYCMGGNASFRCATIFGDKLAVAAAFHPGGLVTDEPASPHLRAKAIQARLYVGPSISDLTPETEEKLRAELGAGRAHFEIDHYSAKHGFAVPDSSAFDAAAAERHYQALGRVFGEGLR